MKREKDDLFIYCLEFVAHFNNQGFSPMPNCHIIIIIINEYPTYTSFTIFMWTHKKKKFFFFIAEQKFLYRNFFKMNHKQIYSAF